MDDTLLKQARQLNLRNGGPSTPIPPIVLMTDTARMPDPRDSVRALPSDSMVIFRHYDHPERCQIGLEIRRICRAKHISFLVAADLKLALRLNADGLHLPEYRILTQPQIYQRIPHWMLRTSACHGPQTIRRLAMLPTDQRPDGVLISPIFPTRSHPGAETLPSGVVQIMAAQARQACMQPIALGGVTANTARKLASSAIASLAGIGFAVGI